MASDINDVVKSILDNFWHGEVYDAKRANKLYNTHMETKLHDALNIPVFKVFYKAFSKQADATPEKLLDLLWHCYTMLANSSEKSKVGGQLYKDFVRLLKASDAATIDLCHKKHEAWFAPIDLVSGFEAIKAHMKSLGSVSRPMMDYVDHAIAYHKTVININRVTQLCQQLALDKTLHTFDTKDHLLRQNTLWLLEKRLEKIRNQLPQVIINPADSENRGKLDTLIKAVTTLRKDIEEKENAGAIKRAECDVLFTRINNIGTSVSRDLPAIIKAIHKPTLEKRHEAFTQSLARMAIDPTKRTKALIAKQLLTGLGPKHIDVDSSKKTLINILQNLTLFYAQYLKQGAFWHGHFKT